MYNSGLFIEGRNYCFDIIVSYLIKFGKGIDFFIGKFINLCIVILVDGKMVFIKFIKFNVMEFLMLKEKKFKFELLEKFVSVILILELIIFIVEK